jgi:hypothetical protein
VFTIRTRIEPLAALAGDAAACAQIAGWLRGLDAATTAYKSLSGSKPAVLDWLDASVEQSAR